MGLSGKIDSGFHGSVGLYGRRSRPSVQGDIIVGVPERLCLSDTSRCSLSYSIASRQRRVLRGDYVFITSPSGYVDGRLHGLGSLARLNPARAQKPRLPPPFYPY